MSEQVNSTVPVLPYEVSIEKYFERCNYSGPRECTLDALRAIMWSHYLTFPFENLNVLLKKPIVIELKAVEEKFIDQKRGGYCFEHSILLGSVLKQLGFEVTQLIGRVIMDPKVTSPNTHAALMVHIDDQRWLVDCWFGPYGSTVPLLISDDAIVHQTMVFPHRLVRHGDVYTHQSQNGDPDADADGWDSLYTFTLQPAYTVDYHLSSWYVETHPESFFVKNTLVSKFWQYKRCILFNNEFKYRLIGPGASATDVEKRVITSSEEYVRVLREYFDLSFPEGTVLYPSAVISEEK